MFKGWNDAPKASLTIRLLIGAYLLYIDYQVYGDVMAREGISKLVMIICMILFAVIGVFLMIMSGRALLGAGEDKKPEKEADKEADKEQAGIPDRGQEDHEKDKEKDSAN